MRTCQSCGLQNPPDRDFCDCGEYLRWEPTGYVQAVTPEMVAQAAAEAGPAAPADETPAPAQQPPQPAAQAPPPAPAAPPPAPAAPPPPAAAAPAPPPPRVEEAPPPPDPPGNGHGSGLTSGDPLGGSSAAAAPPPPQAPQPPAVTPKTAVQQAVPTPPAPAPFEEPAEPDKATITLRLADRDAEKEHALQTDVEPGQRQRVLALVRNQSGIVDNYQLRIEGFPDDWWSIYPDTVYLVPFGTGGTYEQEVEIHLHPPKAPSAEAKLWDLKVVAHSKAYETVAASAPLELTITPYVETSTKVRPERKSGRRKATYGVMVENKANAPVLVALEGEDPDGELQYGFNRPPTEIPPGETVQASMQVRPPKQIWIGRAQERRFSVTTLTGEAAEERLAEEPVSAEELRAQAEGAPRKRRWWKRRGADDIPGVYGPRVYKPQVYAPGLNIGPSGISLRKPQLRGPQLQGPQMKGMNFEAAGLQDKLKRPGGAAAPTVPLLPSQAVFRQKPWLPWWLVPVAIALAALAVLLYLLLPQNVVVPEVVGSASAFEAEEKLTEADLTLAPAPKEKVDPDAEPGSVVSQTPKAGEKAEKGAPVTIEIAVGNGQITVPKVTGLSLADAEAALREKKLSLGQTSPQPPDPNGEIESQIPAENEIVKEGAPVDVFFADPNGKGEGKEEEAKKGDGAPAPGDGAPGGEDANAEIIIPAIDGAELDAFAQKLGDDGLVPQAKRQFDDSPAGTLFATEPPGGTTVKAGAKVTLLVSAGFPQLAFDDDKNIRLVNGANGDKFDPIANSRGTEEKGPAWSPDGTRVAYSGDGRVFLKELEKKDAPAITLTGPDEDFNDLAWAPTADVNLLAMSRVNSNDDRDLCLGQITEDGMTPRCISDPDVSVGTVIRWRPDGKEILAFGVKGLGEFGMVRYRSKQAFSTDPKDWKGGNIVTDTSKSGEGVLDAAYSPDGNRMAIVSNQGGGPFQVFLAKRGDVLLTSAKPTDVRACKAIWRTDGKELVVVQKDATCQEAVGDLARFPVNDPDKQTQLNASGDNMVFQPLTLGG